MSPRPGQAAALLTAAALGFGASQALAQRPSTDLGRSPADALSLEVDTPDASSPSLVEAPDGGLSVILPVRLRNAGPRAVVLEQAELAGTPLRDDTVAGRSVPSGSVSLLTLRRPIDCAQPPSDPAALPGPLTVTATTAAGERQAELRLDDAARSAQELARRACGQVPPGRALEVVTANVEADEGIGQLDIVLRNASAQPLQVRDLLPAKGLRVRLRDSTGAEVAFPLDIPAGDVGSGQPARRPPPVLRLTAVFVVDDCGDILPGSAFPGGPIFELVVADATRTETAPFGEAGTVIAEMEAEVCA